VPNLKRGQRLAKYIDVAELNRRLGSQFGPLGRLDPPFQMASKVLEPGDNLAKVKLLVENASAHAKIVFQTSFRLLPSAGQNSRDFRAAVAEDVIIPHLDELEKSLENKIAFWTAKESYKGERLELLKIAKQLMKDVREGAGWEDPDADSASRGTEQPKEKNVIGKIDRDCADLWKDFSAEFCDLANEEGHKARTKDDYLTASCTYKRGTVVWHERGKPEHGLHSLLKMPEYGIWRVSSGVSENFQERFRALAARAGLALGCPEGNDREDFWLHSLFQDLLENESKHLFAASRDKGGMIRSVCEASAAFCARLERNTVQKQSERSHQRLSSTAEKLPKSQKSNAELTGLRRALLVSKLLEELNTLRPLMQVPDDDFPILSKQNPNYQVFKICRKHISASTWVKLLPDRQSIHSLAFEIAAIECRRSAATIRTAWKRYKNKVHKRAW
jgi:hypothetical protein